MNAQMKIFYDLFNNAPLSAQDAKWFHDCIEGSRQVLSPSAHEDYKQGLLAACLVEEREHEDNDI
jgi:hypothetical protein